ncbi:hypothetical protein niasHT_027869 [Heterodera trifolii]|uniref:Structural maintenance of chromosomes protein 5 n=1 Tax=Heterodera trifolii TaxID=157864 RepID=A0ABD2JKF5_9BILA
MRRSIENKENDVPMTASSASNRSAAGGRTAPSSSLAQRNHSFSHGAIVRIQFTNFLTYDHVTVKPGPHINVVIGPNGTGKSSIICGICLAVGGSPKLLGRSDLIGDFVKHGKCEGNVDLFLWDSRRRRERCFSVHIKLPNSASFFVDNQSMKLTQLRELVKEYNIQVDNPCTFLAQDKVKSFAEQGPQILLKNTEKAGPTELVQLHESLLEKSEEGNELQAQFDRGKKRMDQLELELKTKKARVDSYKEWSNRHKVIVLLRLKKALLEYESELDVQRQQLVELDEISTQLKNVEKVEKKRKKAVENIGRTTAELTEELEQMKRKHKQKTNELDVLKSEMNKLKDDELHAAAQKIAKIRCQHADFETEKARIKNEYTKFRTAYERAKMDYRPNPMLQQMKAELVRDQAKLEQTKRDMMERQNEQQMAKNRLNIQKNEQHELLDAKLSNVVRLTGNAGILSAWNSYRKNRDKFQGPVYVPYLHMRVPKQSNLVFLNNLIGTRDMGIFVFSCKEDEQLLMQGNNPHRIHSTIIDQKYIEQAQRVKLQHEQLPTALTSLGFTSFASTLFEAPDPVFAYLCFTFNLDRVLIGSPAVEQNYERIAHQLPERTFSLFLTPNFRVEVTFSRFNAQQRYTRRTALARIPRLNADHTKVHNFSTNFEAMEEEWRQRQQELDQQIKQYSQDRPAWEQRYETYKSNATIDQDKRSNIEHLYKQMGRMELDLDQMVKGKPNLVEEEAAYGQRKREITASIANMFEQYIDSLNRLRPLSVKCVLADDELKRLKRRRRVMGMDDDDIGEQLNAVKKRYQAQCKIREDHKINVEEAKDAFKTLAKYSPAENEQSHEETRAFTKMKSDFTTHQIPDDADALDERMTRELSKASKGRQEGTEKDVHEYQRLLEEHDKLGTEVRRVGDRNERWKREMDDRLSEWLDPLGELVANISNNFTNFFAQLGCAGEVRLDTPPENKYNVAEYGLSILVKFRNGVGLRVLDPHTQSGGERSVATMLYLLALQNLCPVPFRCMDEVNQGMDPDNERAVFNMMVRLLGNSGTARGGGENIAKTQYFLLTPKLLNGLEFNERVTVHIVHNGPEIEHGDHWDPENFLAGATNGHHQQRQPEHGQQRLPGGRPRQFVRATAEDGEDEDEGTDH